ncbi:MAG: methyltransferase [Spirochaetes bacterium]|nr:methyltransferase [Spirochaetota bacterium]
MTHTITIQRYANNGYGIGFLDGKAVFVPYSAIDDVVAVTITQQAKNYCFATITDIVMPSPYRIFPQCPAFTHCGGCDYLHIPYEHELTIKKQLLHNTLTHIGSIPNTNIPEIEIIHNSRYHYRSHATVHTDGKHVGFYKKDSHSIEPLPQQGCLLLHNEINRTIRTTAWTYDPVKCALDASGNVCFDPTATITESECGITYIRSIDTFFQANRYLRSTMLQIVGELTKNYTSFLDIGCGVGFFSIYVAKTNSMSGEGIDTNIVSIDFAKQNAILNNVSVKFYAIGVENYHPFKSNYDCVILDPPRQGISKRGRKTIVAINPVIIVYVSCNPVTFSRDAKSFIASNYRLQKLYLIDMFPATHHTEVIGLFCKITSR